ncbi:hypothetical protein EVAR_50876_1 [Eumeta japonica]|uniref:Uncharacterized protein n=1 Tax=Eumeta variegata TaxID=151549 RepID=A0A4C1Y5I6_EUMVA|nr:hypothetical protein EVAR_50876_1 [Eumeta japonica]
MFDHAHCRVLKLLKRNVLQIKKPAKCESDSRTEGSVQTCKLLDVHYRTSGTILPQRVSLFWVSKENFEWANSVEIFEIEQKDASRTKDGQTDRNTLTPVVPLVGVARPAFSMRCVTFLISPMKWPGAEGAQRAAGRYSGRRIISVIRGTKERAADATRLGLHSFSGKFSGTHAQRAERDEDRLAKGGSWSVATITAGLPRRMSRPRRRAAARGGEQTTANRLVRVLHSRPLVAGPLCRGHVCEVANSRRSHICLYSRPPIRFRPSSVLRFGPGPACDSVPIRFYSRSVRNSLPHSAFNPDFATSHNFDLDEAGITSDFTPALVSAGACRCEGSVRF